MIQKIDYPNNGGMKPDGKAPRVETGPVQFGNDWSGLFLRGDDAFSLALRIKSLVSWVERQPNSQEMFLEVSELKGIQETILNEVIQKSN